MLRIAVGLGLLVTVLALGSCEETVVPDVAETFEATLIGASEVPPRTTTATGTAVFELNRAGDELKYTLTTTNLQGFTQAHIHQGAPDVNGPIIVYLFGPHGAPGVSSPSVVKSGVIRASDVNPQNFTGNFTTFLNELRNGNLYVNAHTTTFPGGEIRGQLDEDS